MVTINEDLTLARILCHRACQWPSRAARANLPSRADDSHASLRWWCSRDGSLEGLFSLPLNDGRAQDAETGDHSPLCVGFRFDRASLVLLAGETLFAELNLASASEAQAGLWLDGRLQAAGLQPASEAAMPYELAPGSAGYGAFPGLAEALGQLGAAYGRTADALNQLVGTFGHQAVAAPVVRCWPHHFDLAVLFVLEPGDPETARAIGVGFSPGDETLTRPYFYCTPWPVPEPLPTAPVAAPFHWHREGFTSLIAAADDLPEDPPALATALESVTRYAYESLRAR